MWYSKIISKNDGIESILSLFKTEEEFIKHYFSNILFFNPEIVNEQAVKILNKIKNNEKLPVRFTKESKKHFYFENKENLNNRSSKTFKTRKDAHIFSDANNLYHKESDIKVITDKDGNYYVRKEIYDYTGYRISQGILSDYINYTISHIWGNTSNPYFFTSLWNISIIPQTFSFIIDKSKSNSDLVKKIKLITEIIHIELYNPDYIIGKTIITEKNNCENNYKLYKEEYEIATNLIKTNQISFIETKDDSKLTNNENTSFDLYKITEKLTSDIKNKTFAFTLLNNLKENGFKDFNQFTNKEKSKVISKLSYPILINVTGLTKNEIHQKSRPVDSDVYYKKPLFEFNKNYYIVCNDWKEKNKEMILNWLLDKNHN